MIPPDYQSDYQSEYQRAHRTLEQLFKQLQAKITAESVRSADLKPDLAEIQRLQQQIRALLPEQAGSNPSTEPTTSDPAVSLQAISDFQVQAQAIQTEIAKQLRLIETDLLFLQTARQPATAQQHKQRMAERLTLLLRYSAAILDL